MCVKFFLETISEEIVFRWNSRKSIYNLKLVSWSNVAMLLIALMLWVLLSDGDGGDCESTVFFIRSQFA